MIEDISKIPFAYGIMSRAMSPFAKLLWPSLLLHMIKVDLTELQRNKVNVTKQLLHLL